MGEVILIQTTQYGTFLEMGDLVRRPIGRASSPF